jgi:hypothetical protein
VYDSAALGEVLQHPLRGLERDFRHDAPHCLDEVELGVFDGQFGVVLEESRRERTKFGESFNSRESTANNGDGKKAVAFLAGGQVCSLGEVVDEAVTNGDCFFDRLHADCFVGNARNRERTRDRTSREDDLVVLGGVRLAGRRLDGRGLLLVVDGDDLALNDVRLLEVAAQRHNDVARLNRTGGNLGEERLIRHVRKRVNEGDLGFATAKVLLKLESGVETGVTTTDDEDFRHENSCWNVKTTLQIYPVDGQCAVGFHFRLPRKSTNYSVDENRDGQRDSAQHNSRYPEVCPPQSDRH